MRLRAVAVEALVAVSALAAAVAPGSGCRRSPSVVPSGSSGSSIDSGAAEQVDDGSVTLCVLGEGLMGGPSAPFVAVVRDLGTYESLARESGVALARLDRGFFDEGIVIAAFLGDRPTPGYKPVIERTADGFRIREETPPRDAILPQMITSPFEVVSAPLRPRAGVGLDVPDPLRCGLRPYRVVSGTFESRAGKAGERSSFGIEGSVLSGRLGSLATTLVDLRGVGAGEPRAMREAWTSASGTGESSIDGGSFVAAPCRALLAGVDLRETDGRIRIELSPAPCGASDAVQGHGSIVAERSPAEAPPRR